MSIPQEKKPGPPHNKLTYADLEKLLDSMPPPTPAWSKPRYGGLGGLFLVEPIPPEAYEHVWKRAIPGYMYGIVGATGQEFAQTGHGGVKELCDSLARGGATVAMLERTFVVHVPEGDSIPAGRYWLMNLTVKQKDEHEKGSTGPQDDGAGQATGVV